jgi:mRNA-degrading endonuclease RelE of RelBE toxin-antitoxin system
MEVAALAIPPPSGAAPLAVELDGWTATALRDMASRRGLAATEVVARLVEAEAARDAAPALAAADLDARAGGDPGAIACCDIWTVRVTPAAATEVSALPPALQAAIGQQLKKLASDPGPADPDSPDRLRAGFRACGMQWRLILQRDEDARTLRLLVATTRENAPR